MAVRQMVSIPVVGNRPASRARARSPGGQSTRASQAAAYGFQSPQIGRGGGQSAALARVVPSGHGGSSSSLPVAGSRASKLSVVVRKRPMNKREASSQQHDVVICQQNAIIVREPKLKVDLTKYVEEHNFLFDMAFDEHTSNEQLYCACVRPVIDAVFNRAKCTCFAYGQTGSGKTFTMMGPPRRQGEGITDGNRTPGIFLLAAQDIFCSLGEKQYDHLGVYIAFYEIYCGKLFDLLNNRQILHARENAKSNVVIVGLQEHPVENVQELMEVIELGLNSRTTGVTGANVDSSRSHAILQISLKDFNSNKDNSNKEEGKLKEWGKISFIDLAGSERGADTVDTDRQTRMDGAEINKSLLALKECIRALDQQQDHTPFRGSKLTQVLKDSFVGSNCRTVMIANVSPCSASVEHSLNTLRYAYRVKELRREPSRNPGSVADSGGAPPDCNGTLNDDNFGPGPEDSSEEDQVSGNEEVVQPVTSQMRVNNLSAAAEGLMPRPSQPVRPRYTPQDRGNCVAPCGGSSGSSAPKQQNVPTQQLQQQQRQLQLQEQQQFAYHGHQHVRPHNDPRGSFDQDVYNDQSRVHRDLEREPEVQIGANADACSQAALDELARQHDRLIGTILTEEEELIAAHRQHIDTMVELIKEEMVHLNNVDRPGSDVDAYVAGLDRILRLKTQHISEIRARVDIFKDHLRQEDALSRKFQSMATSKE